MSCDQSSADRRPGYGRRLLLRRSLRCRPPRERALFLPASAWLASPPAGQAPALHGPRSRQRNRLSGPPSVPRPPIGLPAIHQETRLEHRFPRSPSRSSLRDNASFGCPPCNCGSFLTAEVLALRLGRAAAPVAALPQKASHPPAVWRFLPAPSSDSRGETGRPFSPRTDLPGRHGTCPLSRLGRQERRQRPKHFQGFVRPTPRWPRPI